MTQTIRPRWTAGAAAAFATACLSLAAAAVPAAAAAAPTDHMVRAWRGDKPSVTPKDFPTELVSDIPGIEPTPAAALDEFGGLKGTRQHATGYFYPLKVGPRWWLIDPAGNEYIDVGVAGVIPNLASPTAHRVFDQKFGGLPGWADATLDLLRANRFNSSGGFSNNEALYGKRFAYTPSWSFMASYGKQKGVIHADVGHVGFQSDCIPAFDPGFEAFCDDYAKRLADRRDDPYLLGCFSDNELPWPIDALDKFLKLDPADPGRQAAEAVLRERKSSADHLTDGDRQAFMYRLADRYFSVVSHAIRKYDPHHLYLGARFHGPAPHNEPLQRAAGKYVDVVSFNLYTVWTPDVATRRQWTEWSGKPCMITEFYAKGVDSGLANDTGAGWLVATQKERGEFYQTFTLGLLKSDVCVGWHWFKYQDNLPDDLATDKSNRHSNKGIVNGAFVPYDALLGEMRSLNERVYPLAAHFDQAH
jgi:hypothetical protein